MSKRTDSHRPGAIVPANYEPVLDYNCATSQDGWPVPQFRVVCTRWNPELKLETSCECPADCMFSCACVAQRAHETGKQVFGSPGKCGVCGACFVYGELWMHTPTGDYVHVGHDCAGKYELLMDRSAAELANKRARAAVATQIIKAERAEDRAAFLAAHDGLAAAFELGDATSTKRSRCIIADIAARFVQFTNISDKQVALVLKLANEIRNPAPAEEQEQHAIAPTGKGIEFTGKIVSAKLRVSEQYGSSWKITIKVTNADGSVWLAWGTAPRSLMDDAVRMAEFNEQVARAAWVAEQMAARAADAEHELPSYRHTERADSIRAALVGLAVEVKATLERPSARDANECETDTGRKQVEQRNAEQHFVFMSRPTICLPSYNVLPKPAKKVRKPKTPEGFCKCGCKLNEERSRSESNPGGVVMCTSTQCSKFLRYF